MRSSVIVLRQLSGAAFCFRIKQCAEEITRLVEFVRLLLRLLYLGLERRISLELLPALLALHLP